MGGGGGDKEEERVCGCRVEKLGAHGWSLYVLVIDHPFGSLAPTLFATNIV
jgi:hypothetical protein